MANIPASSLVYTNFSNVIEGLLPYMICVDHQKRAVVVAIRGSLSLEDVVTGGWGGEEGVEGVRGGVGGQQGQTYLLHTCQGC
jgi:hypothetical protein